MISNNANHFATLSAIPSKRHQRIHGFGCSACWWAPAMGTTDEAHDFLLRLFTAEGLGLNTLRINIGGSVREEYPDFDPDLPLGRSVLSPLKEDGTYDIRRCKGTWTLLQKAMALGTITDLTLFMNSPPSTMTKNGKTYGDDSGIEDVFISNLKPDCYHAYAKYVTDVTELYINAGFPVCYVSPVNEPQWKWAGGQEGCHYEPEELISFYRILIPEFEERKKQNPAMEQVRLSLPETAQWYQKPYVHDLYQLLCTDPEIAPFVDHFCAHSYGTTREQKQEFADFAAQFDHPLPLHQTEYGGLHPYYDPTMDMALELAVVLYEDLSILHVESWSWWLGVGSFTYTDGLICHDGAENRTEIPKRYYVMQQHSRFLKDHTCIEVSAQNLPPAFCASAFLSPDERELVWELVNPDPRDVPLQIDRLPEHTVGEIYETSDSKNFAYNGRLSPENTLTVPGRSVITLVCHLSEEGRLI